MVEPEGSVGDIGSALAGFGCQPWRACGETEWPLEKVGAVGEGAVNWTSWTGMPLVLSSCWQSCSLALRKWISSSKRSVCPRMVARPVLRSVVLQVTWAAAHGLHPPAAESHRILRIYSMATQKVSEREHSKRLSRLSSRLGDTRHGSKRTLHRSHAWPVRVEVLSFLLTETLKSISASRLLFGRLLFSIRTGKTQMGTGCDGMDKARTSTAREGSGLFRVTAASGPAQVVGASAGHERRGETGKEQRPGRNLSMTRPAAAAAAAGGLGC